MEHSSTLIRCFGNILRTTLSAFATELDGTELKGNQAAYILAICQHPGLTQETLARYVSVDKSNVTRNIYELERLLYVERRRGQTDKRQWRLYPTDRSYELLPRLVEIFAEWESVLCRGMSAEEQEVFRELSERMERNVFRYVAHQNAEKDAREYADEESTEGDD